MIGSKNDVSGKANSVKGNNNRVDGTHSQVRGQDNKVSGEGNVVVGSGNIVGGLDSSQRINTDDWFPEWMKDSKTQKGGFSASSYTTKPPEKQNPVNMGFPSWMYNEDEFWSTPKTSVKPKAYSPPQPMRPNPMQHTAVVGGYPYSTSYYYSSPSYYSPWSSWQQFYNPRYTQAAYYNPWMPRYPFDFW